MLRTPLAAACTLSGHLTLLSGAGEGEVVSKEVGEEERGAQGGVDRRSDNATSLDVEIVRLSEIDPHRRRLGRSQTDFALQAAVECRAGESEMNRNNAARAPSFMCIRSAPSRTPCRESVVKRR